MKLMEPSDLEKMGATKAEIKTYGEKCLAFAGKKTTENKKNGDKPGDKKEGK